MKIGFIGLGIMGKAMARNLLKGGHSLVVHDIVPALVDAHEGRGDLDHSAIVTLIEDQAAM